MPKARNPEAEKAEALFRQGKKLIDIANELNLPAGTIRRWKSTYKWDSERSDKKASVRNKGGQPGNKNATGPPENKNAERHGFFAKWLPEETAKIMKTIEKLDPLDILWDNIQLQYAAIIRAQRIMYVKDQEDKSIERVGYKKGKISGEEWEVQQAWDKQATFLNAQSRAMKTLEGMIKQYDELLHKNWASATEEQKLRIDKLKAETAKISKEIESANSESVTEYKGIPASMITPTFLPVLFHIEERDYLEYVFPGGRGSTKSTFISEVILDILMKNDQMHACAMRQVGETLRGSVYNQLLWSIDALGLTDEFHCTVSPLEITRKATGQKIYFRGADDPGKVKSIKVPFGYIGILWLEELDQFAGPESVRKIEQSVIRGGDLAYIFKSFNPPKSASNWANKYIKIPKENRLVTHSTYKDVPAKWLGKPFLDEAEFLRTTNPAAYENEYKGVANGSGGNVFDNVVIREITADEIAEFDRRYKGVDWGWYPDPYHYINMHYDAARLRLYVFDEYRCNKRSNRETADALYERGVTGNDLITCDSAENKSVNDYKDYGLLARGARKGPGSVDYSMKWLQSLAEIVIDNVRCPETATEFLEYEYDRDKDGNVISGYPDANNHGIDAVRYGTESIWRKRGE